MEAIRSYETLVLTRATRRPTPEGGILHSRHRENFKSFTSQCIQLKFEYIWVNTFIFGFTGTFADDTVILACHDDPVTASHKLQGHLDKVEAWLKKSGESSLM
jgi:hypothetical protein